MARAAGPGGGQSLEEEPVVLVEEDGEQVLVVGPRARLLLPLPRVEVLVHLPQGNRLQPRLEGAGNLGRRRSLVLRELGVNRLVAAHARARGLGDGRQLR